MPTDRFRICWAFRRLRARRMTNGSSGSDCGLVSKGGGSAVVRIGLSFTLPLTCDRRFVSIGILRQGAIPDWSESKVTASSIGGWIIVIAVGSLAVWTGQVTAADTDSDRRAVEAVCGRCHTTELFLKERRSWARWN